MKVDIIPSDSDQSLGFSCRPVGVILSKDQDGIDSKIIAVPLTNIDPTSYSSGKLAENRSSSAASCNRTVYLIN